LGLDIISLPSLGCGRTPFAGRECTIGRAGRGAGLPPRPPVPYRDRMAREFTA